MQLFDIFDVTSWPNRMGSLEPILVSRLALKLDITNHFDIQREWPHFRQQVSDHICENKDMLSKSPEEFWTNILNSKSIDVPDSIKELLEFILIIPSGESKHLHLFDNNICKMFLLYYLQGT